MAKSIQRAFNEHLKSFEKNELEAELTKLLSRIPESVNEVKKKGYASGT
ncbi:hypothetical protein OKW21_001927 [Catalinimonas alkaloidigena]|nr:hypothetical protein [Catalinimonas alkaloidigena]MDF9796664.1 hypothetical protein [Catalinimonas alkaloidigena]